jgi:uncharacterized protein DUF4389
MTYPVTYIVEPQLANRNRATTFFRIVLAIPHLILVGGPMFAFGFWHHHWGFTGILGLVAGIMAIIAWFAILITDTHPRGLWDFARYFLSWRARVVTYVALLRDEYPPFGESAYPASLEASYPDAPRDKLSVALRILFVIPHAIVLFFLGIAFFIVTVIAWFAILFTGAYPESMHIFAVGCLRWSLRVESYLLLMRDEYPPFSFEP